MKHNWETSKLYNVLVQYKEYIEAPKPIEYKKLSVKLYGKGAVLDGVVDGANLKMRKHQLAKKGQIILSEIWGKKGAIGVVPEEGEGALCTSHFFLFDIVNDVIDPKYFHLILLSKILEDQLFAIAQGTTGYAATRPKDFLNAEIPLPTLPEQQRIVSKIESVNTKLERIKELRAEQTKDINNLLFSKYTELIEDAEWLPMKMVAPIIRREVNINEDALYPELGIRCFGKGTFHKPAITGLEVGTKTLYQIKKSDLVFSNVFAWEGGIAVAKEDDNERYGSHRFISCVANKEKASEEFLCFHFLSPKGLEDINACSPGGAGRNKTLGLDKLMRIKVPVPDVNLQEEFVELLHKVKIIKNHHQETEKELNELLPSLLDKAFKGEL